MTVRELIASLEKLNPALEVKMYPTDKIGTLEINSSGEIGAEVWITGVPPEVLRYYKKNGRWL